MWSWKRLIQGEECRRTLWHLLLLAWIEPETDLGPKSFDGARLWSRPSLKQRCGALWRVDYQNMTGKRVHIEKYNIQMRKTITHSSYETSVKEHCVSMYRNEADDSVKLYVQVVQHWIGGPVWWKEFLLWSCYEEYCSGYWKAIEDCGSRGCANEVHLELRLGIPWQYFAACPTSYSYGMKCVIWPHTYTCSGPLWNTIEHSKYLTQQY